MPKHFESEPNAEQHGKDWVTYYWSHIRTTISYTTGRILGLLYHIPLVAYWVTYYWSHILLVACNCRLCKLYVNNLMSYKKPELFTYNLHNLQLQLLKLCFLFFS